MTMLEITRDTKILRSKTKKNTTIKDVAELAGVSKITASAVLSDKPQNARFSEATRQRVTEAAQKLHYYPSAIARGMSGRRMNSIGVVLPPQLLALGEDPFVCGLLDGIMACNVERQQTTTVFTGHVWADVQQSLSVFCDGRCDGLVIISLPVDSSMIPGLLNARMPFVVINSRGEDPRVSSVCVNNEEAMYQLVTFVIAQGHRRIAFHGLGPTSQATVERSAGYIRALIVAGIEPNPELMTMAHHPGDFGFERTQALLQLPSDRKPTAICCGTDTIAVGTSEAVRAMGLRVPEDISITGFDDLAEAGRFTPPLTGVRLPVRALGYRAVELLLDQLNDHAPQGRKEVLPMDVVWRQSVVSPPLS